MEMTLLVASLGMEAQEAPPPAPPCAWEPCIDPINPKLSHLCWALVAAQLVTNAIATGSKARIKTCSLKREFFKHLGHFTDEDLKVYVQHLLGKTPNRELIYPKLSVQKPKSVILNHDTASDWVERRKRKKVIIEDMIDIRPDLNFRTLDFNIKDNKWQKWKRLHRFSTPTWDFLFSAPPVGNFTKRLTNEGIHKYALDFVDKFPDFQNMLKSFMKAKYRLPSISRAFDLYSNKRTRYP